MRYNIVATPKQLQQILDAPPNTFHALHAAIAAIVQQPTTPTTLIMRIQAAKQAWTFLDPAYIMKQVVWLESKDLLTLTERKRRAAQSVSTKR